MVPGPAKVTLDELLHSLLLFLIREMKTITHFPHRLFIRYNQINTCKGLRVVPCPEQSLLEMSAIMIISKVPYHLKIIQIDSDTFPKALSILGSHCQDRKCRMYSWKETVEIEESYFSLFTFILVEV